MKLDVYLNKTAGTVTLIIDNAGILIAPISSPIDGYIITGDQWSDYLQETFPTLSSPNGRFDIMVYEAQRTSRDNITLDTSTDKWSFCFN